VFAQYRTGTDLAGRLRLWCAAYGHTVDDVIEHDDACLSEPVTIVLATGSGLPRQALALVSVNGSSPDVYTDRTSDGSAWRDATTIALRCPGGHAWTWDGGLYLRTASGIEAHVSRLFGRGRPVISRCRTCEAFDDGTTGQACPCPGFAVYCPACGDRCQAVLPEIPVMEEN